MTLLLESWPATASACFSTAVHCFPPAPSVSAVADSSLSPSPMIGRNSYCLLIEGLRKYYLYEPPTLRFSFVCREEGIDVEIRQRLPKSSVVPISSPSTEKNKAAQWSVDVMIVEGCRYNKNASAFEPCIDRKPSSPFDQSDPLSPAWPFGLSVLRSLTGMRSLSRRLMRSAGHASSAISAPLVALLIVWGFPDTLACCTARLLTSCSLRAETSTRAWRDLGCTVDIPNPVANCRQRPTPVFFHEVPGVYILTDQAIFR